MAKKNKKEKRVIYYTNELKDNFGGDVNVKPAVISGDYNYRIDKNPFWRIIGGFIYRVIATPIVSFYMRVFRGLKIKNRKALKKIKGGYFLYANHTQVAGDAFMPTIVGFPHKVQILVHPNAVSIPGIRILVQLLGAMPVPSDLAATRNLLDAMRIMLKQKRVFLIYPEATIWKYYNDIRNFKDSSFYYPIKFKVPAVAYTVTYRQRKIFKNARPFITITVSDPIYPQEFTNRKALRDKIYNFMKETVKKENSYEYIKYIKKTDDENMTNVTPPKERKNDDNGSV